jgi:hypothetical protein
MKLNWKIIIAIIIVVVAAIVLFWNSNDTSDILPANEENLSGQELPQATGNIDDAVNAAIISASNEAVAGLGSNEQDLFTGEDQAFSNFGQTYDENQF